MSKELENASELVERSEARAVSTKNTIVINDDSNEVKIPGFPYIFEAKGDKILVAVDIFKTGYECKMCKGEKTVQTWCQCDSAARSESTRPGFKYSKDQLSEFTTLGDSVFQARAEMKCAECQGDYESKRQTITCPVCNGKGSLLYMPDQAKTLPTTGVIVSLGKQVDPYLGYKNGQRVLFGAYVGVMIPTKAPGVVFKVLRDIEILCEIKGGEDMANFDFIIVDKNL